MKRIVLFLLPALLLLGYSCKKQETPPTGTFYDTLKVNAPYMEYSLNENTILTLDATDASATYLWAPNGDTTATITVSTEGVYSVQVTKHPNPTASYQVVVFNNGGDCYAPNSFSPNGDGKNDYWFPFFSNISTENYSLKIYDQNNTKLFTTSDVAGKWDGKYNGQDMPTGYYYYTIGYKTLSGESKNRNGMLQLFR